MKALLFIAVLFVAGPALAQDDERVVAVCESLSRYLPDAQVFYTPGVDVYGGPVVSVDMGSVDLPGFNPVVVPFDVDLQSYFDIESLDRGVELDAELGQIQIYPDGRVTFNSKEVGSKLLYGCEKGDLPDLPEPQVRGVTVTNQSVIEDTPRPELVVQSVPDSVAQKSEKVIDVAPLNAQDNTDKAIVDDGDDDSILEGQYP